MKKLIVLITVCCIVIFLNGCGHEPIEDTAVATAPTEAAMVESDISSAKIEETETETIESVYRDGLDMTLCIYTPNGNNGTGFLYKDKYIVTNAHVLYEAEDFTLKDHKGREYKGTIIYADNESDIAIVQVDGFQGRSVRFGDSDSLAVGEQVILIGNPSDGDPFSYCTGERVRLDEELQKTLDSQNRYIPVDANVVSGYSGGPVFNMTGELVGISNAAYIGDLSAFEYDHLSFIIPINRVKEQIETNCV